MMNFYTFPFFLWGFSALTIPAAMVAAQNVAMQPSSTVAVATTSGGGLLTRQGDTQTPIPLPSGVSGFHDLSIDVDNDSLLFALDVSSPRVCSYTLGSATSLVLNNCVGSSFNTSPFSGVSARGGTLVVSGGTGGVTVFDYDTSTGLLQETPRVQNQFLPVIGFPDVLMISPTQAAMSADIGGTPRFGTVIVDIQGTTLTLVGEFRMEDSLGFDLVVAPANFPFVNAIYEADSDIYMYTANGGMTVQDPADQNGVSVELDPPDASFRAVSVAVNQEMGLVMFGGIADSQSIIYIYSIVDVETVTFVGTIEVEGRITSLSSSGDLVSYVTTEGTTVEVTPLSSASTSTSSASWLSVHKSVVWTILGALITNMAFLE